MVNVSENKRGQKLYYQQAMKEIEASRIAPVYLLYGEEIFLAENLIDQIKRKFLDKIDPELNFFVRYANEEGVDPVISLGAGLGLFSERKLIILKEAQALKKADIDRLIKFIEKKPPEIELILQSSVATLYQTRLKALENRVTTVQLLPLRSAELSKFIISEFGKYQKQVTPDAVDMLIFLVGAQLSDLMVQINNISQYFAEKEKIDVPEVEQIASVYVTQDVFELARMVGEKNTEKAVFILQNLLGSGVAPQQILYQLQRHFSLIWRIQGYYRSGMKNRDAIARELRLFPRYFSEYEAQSRQWNSSRLRRIFQLLYQADRDLKDSSVNPQIVLDILIYQIINS